MTISLSLQQTPLDRGQRRRRPLPHQVAWVAAVAAVTTVSSSCSPTCAAAAFSSKSSAPLVSRRHQSARTRRIPNVPASSSSTSTTSQLSVGWMYEDDGMLSSSSSATQPLHARQNRDQRSRVAAASVSMTDDATVLPASSDRTSITPTTTLPEWSRVGPLYRLLS
jgi:hypothetical protein